MEDKDKALSAIIDILAGIGESERDEKREHKTEIDIICSTDGEKKFHAGGDAGVFAVKDAGGDCESMGFGNCSPLDVAALVLAILKNVAELDGLGVSGKRIVTIAIGAFLQQEIGHDSL